MTSFSPPSLYDCMAPIIKLIISNNILMMWPFILLLPDNVLAKRNIASHFPSPRINWFIVFCPSMWSALQHYTIRESNLLIKEEMFHVHVYWHPNFGITWKHGKYFSQISSLILNVTMPNLSDNILFRLAETLISVITVDRPTLKNPRH